VRCSYKALHGNWNAVELLETVLWRDYDTDVSVITVMGVLSMASALPLWTALRKCLAQCPAGVVVDTRALQRVQALAVTVMPAAAMAHRRTLPDLIAADLVTDACMEGGSANRLDIRRQGPYLLVAVTANSRQPHTKGAPELELSSVDLYCTGWKVRPHRSRQIAWAAIRIAD
jgi:hypothetical protein